VGYFNPETHSVTGGKSVPVNELFERIVELGGAIEGITVSGGELLQQAHPLVELLSMVRQETALPILVFSGYTWEETRSMPESDKLMQCIDVLIAGRYDHTQASSPDCAARKIRPSTGLQTVIPMQTFLPLQRPKYSLPRKEKSSPVE
jgi:organic radical activating enzyme